MLMVLILLFGFIGFMDRVVIVVFSLLYGLVLFVGNIIDIKIFNYN